ncbi:MAG: GNAT family N-acetyltransferase [Planctomycetota bacterium]|nr:GNAT family N-acetyltransferase [Planctomycetota bacterium]
MSQEDQQNVGPHSGSGKLPGGYTVRAADTEDLHGIVAVLEPFVHNEVLLRRSEAEISNLISTGFVAVHQADAEDRVVGFCSVEIYSKKLAEILCLAVAGRHQGHGIGGLLVQKCVALAKAKGVMEVMAISSSEQFLHSLGFDYTLPHQKRALFYPLRDRAEFNDLK